MKNKSYSSKHSTESLISLVVFIIAFIGLAIVPLLVRVTPVANYLNTYSWYNSDAVRFDSYSLIKSNVILFLGVASLIILFIRQYLYKTYSFKDPIVITSLLFLILILLSQFFSSIPNISNSGMIDRFESSWVWISYILIFLCVYGENWSDKALLKIKYAFLASTAILGIIGVFQYLGFDPVFNNLTKPFITSFKMNGIDFNADYSINYKVIVQTLYHYNYVGFYLSLSIPFILTFILHEKNRVLQLSMVLLLALSVFNLLGSSARGGLVGVIASIPFFIYFNRHILIKNNKVVLVLCLVFVIVFTAFEASTNGFITTRIKSIFTSVETQNKLNTIEIIDNQIKFELSTGELLINVLSDTNSDWTSEFYFNSEPTALTLDSANNYYVFDDEKLNGVNLFLTQYDTLTMLTINAYGEKWNFAYDDTKELKYVNAFGKFDIITQPDTLGFEGREKLGSSRGYIWSRTLPLILEKPILGYGADTFAVVFPQQDYVGKYNAYNTTNMIVDKSHNMYLQIPMNSGIPSLIVYLGLTILVLYKGFIYNRSNPMSSWNVAIVLSVISYSVAAFFNDSSVQLSSVFWVLLALSASISKFNVLKK